MRPRQTAYGFTLIETVIALFLLAVMSVMAYQAVAAVMLTNQRSHEDLSEEMALQRAWQIISNDLIHLRQRPYPDGLGGVEGAYETGLTEDVLVSFSRGAGPVLDSNPSGLSRVSYRLSEGGELLRSSWPVFQARRDSNAQERVLLRNVQTVLFVQLAPDDFFTAVWPPIDMRQQEGLTVLPRMIEVSIELQDGSRTRRMFPGVEDDV